MNRRGFLGAILATGCAPAIVRASSLMRIVSPSLVVPTLEQTIAINGFSAMITRETLRVLQQNLTFSDVVNRQWLDSKNMKKITIRRPPRYKTA